jgi:aldehyde:ferredoxin oxidoreductase
LNSLDYNFIGNPVDQPGFKMHGSENMMDLSLDRIAASHKIISKFQYVVEPVRHRYANRTLYVNVGTNQIMERQVSQQMKDLFTGGKGFGLWLLWNAVSAQTKWQDAENE